MRDVEAILTELYGGLREAVKPLGVRQNSPWNWRKQGYFPATIAIALAEAARSKRKKIPLSEIPTKARASQ